MGFDNLKWVDLNKTATPAVAKAVEEYAIAYSSVRKAVDTLSAAYAAHLGMTSILLGWKNGTDKLSYALTAKSKPVEKPAKAAKAVKAARTDADAQVLMERIAMLERALSLKAQAFSEPDDDDDDDDDDDEEPVKPIPVRRKKR